MVFGLSNLSQNIRDLVSTTFQGGLEQVLADIVPNYNAIKPQLVNALSRLHQRTFGRKFAKNQISESEIQISLKIIASALGSTYNPVSIVKNFLRLIFGISKDQRAINELDLLKNYAHYQDSYKFANKILRQSFNLLKSRLSSKQGLGSSLGLKKNPQLEQDAVVSALKSLIQTWLEIFRQLKSGSIPGIAFSSSDAEFLEELRTQFRNGGFSWYTQDLADQAESILASQNRAEVPRQRGQNLSRSLAA